MNPHGEVLPVHLIVLPPQGVGHRQQGQAAGDVWGPRPLLRGASGHPLPPGPPLSEPGGHAEGGVRGGHQSGPAHRTTAAQGQMPCQLCLRGEQDASLHSIFNSFHN